MTNWQVIVQCRLRVTDDRTTMTERQQYILDNASKNIEYFKKKNMKYAYLQIQRIDIALKKALDDSTTTNNNFIVFELFKINNMPKNKTSSLKTK